MAEKIIRFDEFELDFGRFQLCRNGRPLGMEGLPLRLLICLVDRHRQLVTRQQIADELWGRDVFVDIEQGINTAVRKIRIALEDNSAQPRYLQTVVGRGYRFVGTIQLIEGDPQTAVPMVTLEELGQAIMAAAGIHPEEASSMNKERKNP